MFSWKEEAWEEYVAWQNEDRKTLKRINKLIRSIQRDGYNKGLGKPEPLKHNLSGVWSRRINDTDRLVYVPEGRGDFTILQCKSHYDS
ncbi:Txe/YoeB family addiction module toxin [Limosilactobacillus mucosae]|uniref:Txe/YoeB family addiction module toxin n=1 Tax=Limosilactobacillus mucosae TaxID=97478 RepID=UPI00233E777A|nr:Txe/YoeB family addiction module toxin [Limosilactobacillus mucosae]MDC2839350.1 Txe/YoeB family addiction module toxin [Limosilactobacillus mucosae]MDC2841218.1 Txe/YoeB family addiction module toxin [Limosilactobacillus mucosae]MDC2845310.1 Txe/YoeB family addiction module toxin [Limosilactobacillus mucosae]